MRRLQTATERPPHARPWVPDQYNRFRQERMQPFEALVALIEPSPDMRIVDLGCGTGELTAQLANAFPTPGSWASTAPKPCWPKPSR